MRGAGPMAAAGGWARCFARRASVRERERREIGASWWSSEMGGGAGCGGSGFGGSVRAVGGMSRVCGQGQMECWGAGVGGGVAGAMSMSGPLV